MDLKVENVDLSALKKWERGPIPVSMFFLHIYPICINRKNLPVCYTDLKTIISLILTSFFLLGRGDGLSIHAFCVTFEINRLRNTSVIGEKPSKMSKIGYFFDFFRPRSYMELVNTRILRPFWSKSVEKHQCYRRKTLKNVKNRVFFEFWRPPRPKIKNRAS